MDGEKIAVAEVLSRDEGLAYEEDAKAAFVMFVA